MSGIAAGWVSISRQSQKRPLVGLMTPQPGIAQMALPSVPPTRPWHIVHRCHRWGPPPTQPGRAEEKSSTAVRFTPLCGGGGGMASWSSVLQPKRVSLASSSADKVMSWEMPSMDRSLKTVEGSSVCSMRPWDTSSLSSGSPSEVQRGMLCASVGGSKGAGGRSSAVVPRCKDPWAMLIEHGWHARCEGSSVCEE